MRGYITSPPDGWPLYWLRSRVLLKLSSVPTTSWSWQGEGEKGEGRKTVLFPPFHSSPSAVVFRSPQFSVRPTICPWVSPWVSEDGGSSLGDWMSWLSELIEWSGQWHGLAEERFGWMKWIRRTSETLTLFTHYHKYYNFLVSHWSIKPPA